MATETKKNQQNAAANVSTGRRELQGVIVKRSGDKTVAVEVTRVTRHKLYHRKIVKSKKYLVHDEGNVGEVGQSVIIREAKPMSAKKRWMLVVKKS